MRSSVLLACLCAALLAVSLAQGAWDGGKYNQKLANPNHACGGNRAVNNVAGGCLWHLIPTNPAGVPVYTVNAKGQPVLRGYLNSNQPDGSVLSGINYGVTKKIGGMDMVYAFADTMRSAMSGNTNVLVSGWVPLANVSPDQRDDIASQTVQRNQRGATPPACTGPRRKITGGSNAFKAKYSALKVVKTGDTDHTAAMDYMLRDEHVVNILFGLPGKGGVTSDTVFTDNEFQICTQVRPVQVPLYLSVRHCLGMPESAPQADVYAKKPYKANYVAGCDPTKVVAYQKFVYGYVSKPAQSQRHYAWIANGALQGAKLSEDQPGPQAKGHKAAGKKQQRKGGKSKRRTTTSTTRRGTTHHSTTTTSHGASAAQHHRAHAKAHRKALKKH